MTEFRGDLPTNRPACALADAICLYSRTSVRTVVIEGIHDTQLPGHGSESFWSRVVGRLSHVPNQVPNSTKTSLFLSTIVPP